MAQRSVPAGVATFDVGALVEEEADQVDVFVVGGAVQRFLAFLRVYRGSELDEALRHVRASLPCGIDQRPVNRDRR